MIRTVLCFATLCLSALATDRTVVAGYRNVSPEVSCSALVASLPDYLDRLGSLETAWRAWDALEPALALHFSGYSPVATVEGAGSYWTADEVTDFLKRFAERRKRDSRYEASPSVVLLADLLARERLVEAARRRGDREATGQQNYQLLLRVEIFRVLALDAGLPVPLRAEYLALVHRQVELRLELRGIPFRKTHHTLDGRKFIAYRIPAADALDEREKEPLAAADPIARELVALAGKVKRLGYELEILPGKDHRTHGIAVSRTDRPAVHLLISWLLGPRLQPSLEEAVLGAVRSDRQITQSGSRFGLRVRDVGTRLEFQAGPVPNAYQNYRDGLFAASAGRDAAGAWLEQATEGGKNFYRERLPLLGDAEDLILTGLANAHRTLVYRERKNPRILGFAGPSFGLERSWFLTFGSLATDDEFLFQRPDRIELQLQILARLEGTVARLRELLPGSESVGTEAQALLVDTLLEIKRTVEAAAYDAHELAVLHTTLVGLRDRHRRGEDVSPELRRLGESLVVRSEKHLSRQTTVDATRLWAGRPFRGTPSTAPVGPVATRAVAVPGSPWLVEALAKTTVPAERRRIVERMGMLAVIELLRRNKVEWMDVSLDNLGFDIAARDGGGRIFEIEVKATADAEDRNRMSFSVDEIHSLLAAGQRGVVARPVLLADGTMEIVLIGHGLSWR